MFPGRQTCVFTSPSIRLFFFRSAQAQEVFETLNHLESIFAGCCEDAVGLSC